MSRRNYSAGARRGCVPAPSGANARAMRTMPRPRPGLTIALENLVQALSAAIDAKCVGYRFLGKVRKGVLRDHLYPTQKQLDAVNDLLGKGGRSRFSCPVREPGQLPKPVRIKLDQRAQDAAELDRLLAQPMPAPPRRGFE
jgi:hypothetical protein